MKDVTFTRKTVKVLTLNKQFLNPELLYTPGNLDKFLVGLATQSSQKFDNVVSDEVTNHLLQPKDKNFGLDLVALNVQRGRDHGLQGYNAFRELCGLEKAKSFDRLANLIPRKIVSKMKEIYESVDDVDLFIGGISETPTQGSILGPTFQVPLTTLFKLFTSPITISMKSSSVLSGTSSRDSSMATGKTNSSNLQLQPTLQLYVKILLRLKCKPEAVHGGAAGAVEEGEPGKGHLRQRGQHQLHPAPRLQETLGIVRYHWPAMLFKLNFFSFLVDCQ